MNDPIVDFFKKLPEFVPGVVLSEEHEELIHIDLGNSREDTIFMIDKNLATWEALEEGLGKIFAEQSLVRLFPSSPTPKDGGRGYAIRNPLWLITFSRFSIAGKHQLKCSVQGTNLRLSSK